MPNYAGYLQVHVPLATFTPAPDYLVVEEDLDRPHSLLALLRRQNWVFGTVLKTGSVAEEQHNIHAGDIICYEEYQGGRWSLEDPTQPDGQRRILIMLADALRCKVVPADGATTPFEAAAALV